MSKPGAFDFEITKVRLRYVDRVQRYALSTLTGATKKKGVRNTEAVIADSMGKLIKEWRNRVHVLRGEGWERPTGKSLIYTLNCPPVGVLTNQKTKPCNQYLVCPFCWCRRYVEETYLRLESAYYSRDTKQPLRLDLVEVKTTERLRTDEWTLSKMFRFIQEHRRDYLDHNLPNEGAFQLFTIEPCDPRGRRGIPRWKFQQRILAMIDPAQESPSTEPDFNGQKREVRRHNGIDRKKLVNAVGRTCLYPVQMMRGPKVDVVDLLERRRNWGKESTKGFRMSSYYGLLRKKQIDERLTNELPPR